MGATVFLTTATASCAVAVVQAYLGSTYTVKPLLYKVLNKLVVTYNIHTMITQEVSTTLSKAAILELNNAFVQAKVKGLAQQPYINLLTLKVELSGLVEQLNQARAAAIKTVLKELGFNDGEAIPTERHAEVSAKLSGVIASLFNEEVELNTKVLSVDELYDSILSINENSTLATEQKALLMRYLVK